MRPQYDAKRQEKGYHQYQQMIDAHERRQDERKHIGRIVFEHETKQSWGYSYDN